MFRNFSGIPASKPGEKVFHSEPTHTPATLQVIFSSVDSFCPPFVVFVLYCCCSIMVLRHAVALCCFGIMVLCHYGVIAS